MRRPAPKPRKQVKHSDAEKVNTMTTPQKTIVDAPVAAAVTSVDTTNVPESVNAEPSVINALAPVVMGNELRKKELFELVVERSGMKKRDVKPVVEAMLAVLGEAFAEHREMQLQPLGKLKLQRAKEMPDGRVLVLKLRQKSALLNATTNVADDAQAAHSETDA